MIVITPHEDGYLHGFRVEGHAGYGEHGKDIVCASVSALAHMTVLGLQGVTDVKILEAEPGALGIDVVASSTKSDLLIKTFIHALKDVAQEYPLFVKVVRANSVTW